MSSSYQPFLISEFKTGLFQYLSPWIRPNDAFEPLENAFIYRGALNKRDGMTVLGVVPDSSNTIMGLKQWTDESSGDTELVALTTRRASLYNNSTSSFVVISGVSQQIYSVVNSTTAPVILSTPVITGWPAVPPSAYGLASSSVIITDGTSTIHDTGNGFFASGAPGNFIVGSSYGTIIDYSSGVITLQYSAPVLTTSSIAITMTASLAGDYFTGDISNFFNSTNWQGDLWLTNNKDRITVFNGTTLARPSFPITQSHALIYTNDITTCLDLDVYKNRLLVQKPKLVGSSTADQQSIRWSAINNPTNLVADIAGNGGELSAPTDDFIQSSEFLRDTLIVLFRNSLWTFRYTGYDAQPFVFQKINNTKSINAPYATIPYDERITAMGSKGLIACDGVNVQRYDLPVIDVFLNNINQSRFGQCFAQRFDSINQSWMLYPSDANATGISDQALIYNFMENTWSTYKMTLSCLGIFYEVSDAKWNSFAVSGPTPLNWEDADFTWNAYRNQKQAPTLLGGNDAGTVFVLSQGVTDNGVAIPASITTTQWNPFLGTGERVQIGYIDFYYETNPDTTLTLTFYVDNSLLPADTKTLVLEDTTGNNGNLSMQRVFINYIGEFVQMNISSSSESNFKILGMILWARPSGRLTP